VRELLLHVFFFFFFFFYYYCMLLQQLRNSSLVESTQQHKHDAWALRLLSIFKRRPLSFGLRTRNAICNAPSDVVKGLGQGSGFRAEVRIKGKA
jgi:hypothetical protein